MARQLRPLADPLRSWQGIRSDPHAPGNQFSEHALVARRWNSAPMLRLREQFDAVEATTKPYKWPRSQLLGFCVVSLALRNHLRDAHRRIQSDPVLRELLDLPVLSARTTERLARARRREDVSEDGFPPRTVVEDFIHRWLPAHPELLAGIDREAYETVPLNGAMRHDISFARFAVDGTQLRSAHRGRRGEKTDPGARLMGREGERAELQRWKFTGVLTDVPFVIDSETVTPEAESPYVCAEMFPRLKRRSDRMRDHAKQQGRPDFKGFDRAAALGDNAYANTPVYEALYDHGMYGAFEPPEFPERIIEGRRLVSYQTPGESAKRQSDLFACNDGVHFCECEAGKPADERTPMTQYAGRFGKTGEVYVECEQLLCRHRGQRLYVPFRKHDRELARGRREAGEVDYTRVNPLWRGNHLVAACNWLGRQTIEHYHQQRFELFGLGSKDRRSMRRFIGDAAVRLWHMLGDLLWNLTVLENLDGGDVKPQTLDPELVYNNALANGRNVARLRGIGRAARAKRVERERRKRSRRGRFKSGGPPALRKS